MTDTKSMIIGQILKLERPFRPRHIWEPLGISSQALNNYLSKFVDQGILTKAGSTYSILNKELLIEEMVQGVDKQKLELPSPNTTFLWGYASLNNTIKLATAWRVLSDPRASNMIRVINEEIDDQIAALKQHKRFLNRKVWSHNRAEKIVADAPLDQVWALWEKPLSFYYDKEEFVG